MELLTKITSVFVGLGILYGLYISRVIDGQSAVVVGIMSMVMILVAMDFRFALQSGLSGLRSDINERIGKLERVVEKIATYLTARDRLGVGYFNAGSPLVLTNTSLDFFRDSGAKKIIDGSLDILFAQIKEKGPKNELDTKSAAYTVVNDFLADDRWNAVKNFIYQHPRYPDANGAYFDELVLSSIMTVYLTGEYLKHHSPL